MSDITKTQYSLAVKAEHNKQHRFEHLYRLICREEWITQAVECGKPGRLDTHHKQSRKQGGKDEIQNLIPLCRTCHAKTPSFGGTGG